MIINNSLAQQAKRIIVITMKNQISLINVYQKFNPSISIKSSNHIDLHTPDNYLSNTGVQNG